MRDALIYTLYIIFFKSCTYLHMYRAFSKLFYICACEFPAKPIDEAEPAAPKPPSKKKKKKKSKIDSGSTAVDGDRPRKKRKRKGEKREKRAKRSKTDANFRRTSFERKNIR